MSEVIILWAVGQGEEFEAEARELDPVTGVLTDQALRLTGYDSDGFLRSAAFFAELTGTPIIVDSDRYTVEARATVDPESGAATLTGLTPDEAVRMIRAEAAGYGDSDGLLN